MIIIRVAHALDRLANLVSGEFERSGTHDVLLIPVRVLVEDLLLVNKVIRARQRRHERACRKFEMNDDRVRVRRRDIPDHDEIRRARAQYAFRRKHDHVEAFRDVFGGHLVAVVEFDVVANLECIGLPVVGRFRHFGADIADEIGRRRRVLGIDSDQRAVERRNAVDHGIGRLAVTVKARRRIGRDHIGQRAAVFRGLRRFGNLRRLPLGLLLRELPRAQPWPMVRFV